MSKEKDTRTYTVDGLTAGEVKRIGYGRWVRNNKALWWYGAVTAISLAIIVIPRNIMDNTLGNNWYDWNVLIAFVLFLGFIIYGGIKSTKVEDSFLKEIQEKK
jgi:hypothetical protein